jgi:ankyrin repeat protein
MAQLLLLAAPEAATVAGTYGRTPLHLAAGIGHAETALQLVAAAPAAATVAGMDGCTPLHLAALYGHAEMVQPLAAAPETAAMVDAAGWTPLAWPAREGKQRWYSCFWHLAMQPPGQQTCCLRPCVTGRLMPHAAW